MSRTKRNNPNYRPVGRYIRSKTKTLEEFIHHHVMHRHKFFDGLYWSHQKRKWLPFPEDVDVIEFVTKIYYDEYLKEEEKDTRDGNNLYSPARKKFYSDRKNGATRSYFRDKLKNPDNWEDIHANEVKWKYYYGDEWVMW